MTDKITNWLADISNSQGLVVEMTVPDKPESRNQKYKLKQ